jgi:hypothetical protein
MKMFSSAATFVEKQQVTFVIKLAGFTLGPCDTLFMRNQIVQLQMVADSTGERWNPTFKDFTVNGA